MGDLTKDFSRHEFACHCGCDIIRINEELAHALQVLRDVYNKPILINSGYRCRKYNKKIGGVKNSQHILGRAADIHIVGKEPAGIASTAVHIKSFKHGGIGVYKDFVHLDVRGKTARWGLKWR